MKGDISPPRSSSLARCCIYKETRFTTNGFHCRASRLIFPPKTAKFSIIYVTKKYNKHIIILNWNIFSEWDNFVGSTASTQYTHYTDCRLHGDNRIIRRRHDLWIRIVIIKCLYYIGVCTEDVYVTRIWVHHVWICRVTTILSRKLQNPYIVILSMTEPR